MDGQIFTTKKNKYRLELLSIILETIKDEEKKVEK